MKGLAILNAYTLKLLERVIMAFGLVTLTICLFLFGNAAYNFFQYNETIKKLNTTKTAIQKLNEILDQAKNIKLSAANTNDLGTVQAALDRFARANECQLVEAVSTNEEAPYLSRYQKTTDDKGWKQVTVQCQVLGPLANVMSMVKGVSLISVPIEIQTFEISPVEKLSNGRPQVIVKFGLQVLKQEATL